jgi:hypothetical protein
MLSLTPVRTLGLSSSASTLSPSPSEPTVCFSFFHLLTFLDNTDRSPSPSSTAILVAWIGANVAGTTKKAVMVSLYQATSAAGNVIARSSLYLLSSSLRKQVLTMNVSYS